LNLITKIIDQFHLVLFPARPTFMWIHDGC
jgi:hypothetical protein